MRPRFGPTLRKSPGSGAPLPGVHMEGGSLRRVALYSVYDPTTLPLGPKTVQHTTNFASYRLFPARRPIAVGIAARKGR